ncbi:MAG: amidase family protein [Pseudomonadota bacterium]
MKDWLNQSAADLGRGIAAGQIDPVELTEAFFEAIEVHHLKDRTYVRLTRDRAMAEAKAAHARAQIGLRRSPLDGVPISWKDLFDTAGIATEAGSNLLKNRVPDSDAEVLRNATAQGLVCLGKTHMSELAFSGLGYNPSTATPPCVNDVEAVPGGSSSGAAASVAFGMAPAAIGSDTGGSVRVPSAWNDLVGLKTTAGRLSLHGCVPLSKKFDTVGPLAKTVEDTALLIAAMEGRTPPDLKGASLMGCRFAILKTVVLDDVRGTPMAAFESAVERLKAAGAAIETLDLPELEEAMSMAGPLMPGQVYGLWRDVIEANPDAMFAEIRTRFRLGKDYSAPDYNAAWDKLEDVRRVWGRAVAGLDAVLAPTSAILPPNLEKLKTDSDYYKTENLLALRNTRLGNMMGVSALTLPTGVPSCGIMFMAAPFAEERLLRVGTAAEEALA